LPLALSTGPYYKALYGLIQTIVFVTSSLYNMYEQDIGNHLTLPLRCSIEHLWLTGTNALAYFTNVLISMLKSFIVPAPGEDLRTIL
jgi:hypothetical protein